MRANVFRTARVVLSLLCFLLFVFAFVDAWNTRLSVWISQVISSFQFIPSVISFLTVLLFSTAGFIIILIITLLFGRIYCSTLCPLGTFQDIMIFVGKMFKNRKKRRFHYSRPYRAIKYLILTLALLSLLGGAVTVLILLDPYSLFGRMATHLADPLFTWSVNIIVELLKFIGIYGPYPIDYGKFQVSSFLFSLLVFVFITALTFWKGRLYCNLICPVGIFLGLVARVSFFRITIDKTSCNQCGSCDIVCKASCIDSNKHLVDFERCIACMDCLTACKEQSIDYHPSWFRKRKEILGFTTDKNSKGFPLDRRQWMQLFMGILPLGIFAGTGEKTSQIQKGRFKTDPRPNRKGITPPGSYGREHFTSHCTACHLCVSQCPTKVLQPSLSAFGLEGAFQPCMDYPNKYCLYECNICGQLCPSGAIRALETEEKKRIQIGKARFLEEYCVVVTNGTSCGACSEHCPTKACDMVSYKGDLLIPKVDESICIGCGACEHPCPTLPKSIVVDENIIHLVAGNPMKKDKTNKNSTVILTDDFPF